MKSRPTVRRSLVLDAGLDKLQAFLLGMVPGDEVSVRRAMEVSGLDAAQCDAVLDAVARAGVMMRLQHDAYVRRSLGWRAGAYASGGALRPVGTRAGAAPCSVAVFFG